MTKNDMEKTGLEDALSTGKAAADTVRIGKAVAKGAAAGGLWGAAASALVGGREYAVKAAIGAAVALMVPLLFILMLPSLIFGGLSGAAEGMPVMNDSTAVSEHLAAASETIYRILWLSI